MIRTYFYFIYNSWFQTVTNSNLRDSHDSTRNHLNFHDYTYVPYWNICCSPLICRIYVCYVLGNNNRTFDAK